MKKIINDIYNWLGYAGFEFGDKSKINLSLDLVKEEYTEFLYANQIKNNEEIVDAIVDMLWVMCNNAYFNGIEANEIVKMFKLVNKSNYSKFCNSENEAINTVESYKKGHHFDKIDENIDCFFEKVNDKYIIKRKTDGKILKSIKYKSVNKLKNI